MREHPLTRRRLLGIAGAGALAGVAASSQGLLLPPDVAAASGMKTGVFDDGTDAVPDSAGEPGRVIVIGAGFAGLAAANALQKAGVNCVVLEARDRLGGRAHTRKVGGVPVDFGCSWIHEPGGNPMSKFAEQAGIRRLPASPEADAATVRFYDEEFGVVPDDQKIAAYLKALLFDQSFDDLGRQLGRRGTVRQGATLFADQQGLTGDQRRWALFTIRMYAQLEDATDWDRLPMLQPTGGRLGLPTPNHDPYEAAIGLGDFPRGGYSRLVKSLAGRMDVRLGERVISIDKVKGRVEVVTSAHAGGRTRRRKLTGSHVIVTVPLGVLKGGGIHFASGLPSKKKSAIRRMGFGQFEKVALTFAKPFWEDEGQTHLIHQGDRDSADFPLILDLQKFIGSPTLVALNSGSFAVGLDRQHPARVRDALLGTLSAAYGRNIPKPLAYGVSNWHSDPFARGAYSAVTMKTGPDDRQLLAAPADGRILFAGEATNLDGRPSTADGAFSSGIREAKRLLQTSTVLITSG